MRKREDELRDLKVNLNTQISTVYDQYKDQVQQLSSENAQLKEDSEHHKMLYQDECKQKLQILEEFNDTQDRLDRSRLMQRENAKELIETESKVADFEERLLITEQQLINAKACWANAEHEREQMYNRLQEMEENMRNLELTNANN